MLIVRGGAPGSAGSGPRCQGESGNVMVVALLVLLVLTTAGVAYVAVTKSEKQIASNTMTAAQALYAAEAGLTEGLHRMSFPAESANYIGPAVKPYAGWGAYIVMAPNRSALDPDGPALESDGLDNDNDAQIDEAGERYPEVLTKQTVNASALRYPYVRVEYKTQGANLVRFGDSDNNPVTPPVENLTKGTPILRITARGRQGTADKMLEAEAVRFPIVQAESPVWAGGPLELNGNAFVIDGHDHYATAPYDTVPGAAQVPGILTEGSTADASLALNQEDNVSGAGGDGSVTQSPFTYDFNAIMAQYASLADRKFSGSQTFSNSTPTYGSLDDPQVTFVDGDLSCGGQWKGGGVLVVNGSLSMGGLCQFAGIVIVMGDVDIAGGGPADVAHILGALIYQGSLIQSSSIGGSSSTYYSSEAINAAQSVGRYTLSWWRER